MCGIAGVWSPEPIDFETKIRRMIGAIAHRGPDSDGVTIFSDVGLALGHKRLAIVDLSDAGHQPMTSACQRYCIVYNGEIYNHREIRGELQSAGSAPNWRGESDTETLLAAVSAWGIKKTLSRLNGMFAFAIWDHLSRSLTLARDRFGEKPLYYGYSGGRFVFASELRAIKAGLDQTPNLDLTSVSQFLRYSSIPAPRSVYERILKLESAHYVTFSSPDSVGEPACFWDANEIAVAQQSEVSTVPDHTTYTESVDSLHGLLRTAVGARLMSDVPLGAFLSGGIDSSLVVALMQEHLGTRVNTFTIGFEEKSHDESEYARAVADHLGTNHTEKTVTSREAQDVIPNIAEYWDEPFSDSSQIPTYLVSKLARESVTVCLSGDGGDELFGGYRRYAKTLEIREKLSRRSTLSKNLLAKFSRQFSSPLSDLATALSGKGNCFGAVSQLDRISALSDILGTKSDDGLYEAISSVSLPPSGLVKDPLKHPPRVILDLPQNLEFTQRMMQRDLSLYLPEVILTKVDRASMAVSLETRAPLLDPSLAEFAFGLPWHLKRFSGTAKAPMVSVLSRYVPASMIDRPKKGFGVPIASWLRGPLRSWAEDLLQPNQLASLGFYDVPAITRMWDQHKTNRQDWHHALWGVLMFQSWLRTYH